MYKQLKKLVSLNLISTEASQAICAHVFWLKVNGEYKRDSPTKFSPSMDDSRG